MDISKDIKQNAAALGTALGIPNNADMVVREFEMMCGRAGFLVFVDGMCDRSTINRAMLLPLLNSPLPKDFGKNEVKNLVVINQLKEVKAIDDVVTAILGGDTGLFLDGMDTAFTAETKGYGMRGVEKPTIETSINGPQESFNENLKTNTTLVRRIIRNPALTTEYFTLGKVNRSNCAIMYIKGLARESTIDTVRERLKNITNHYASGMGIIEQLIEDRPDSLLPSGVYTERPDMTAAHLKEGLVAIIADGTPYAWVVPGTFRSMLKITEDTQLRQKFASFLRLIRIISLFTTLTLPALYIAITNFHKEVMPVMLLSEVAKARSGVPFPTFLELFLLEISFEIIREAGLRVPSSIGNTMGIVGALILGQAAVEANLVSPLTIIIVAVTGLCNFALPDYNFAFAARIYRLIFAVAASLFGFVGLTAGLLICLTDLSASYSFGIPVMGGNYTTPQAKKLFPRAKFWKKHSNTKEADGL